MLIKYELNGGNWDPKAELKTHFLTDFYNFVLEKNEVELPNLEEFLSSEPYIIGNLLGKYFLFEEVGGKLKNQPNTHFIGYVYKNKKYRKLIEHLIVFFALWREIEHCTEEHATDFFASSWASLVDTAKFFKYTTVEDLRKSPEAPSVQDKRIIDLLQSSPDLYNPPTSYKKNTRLAIPKRDDFEFVGWYDNSDFMGEALTELKEGVFTYYARWQTYTLIHSNDGYVSFDSLYADFLKDFSNFMKVEITNETERLPRHGLVSEFCKVSFNGNLNGFFSVKAYYDKWIWLVDYFNSLYKDYPKKQARFEYSNSKFGLEAQVRWELNSLFVSRFHLVWPTTKDYSGIGIKEKLADSTNSQILKIKYLENSIVELPKLKKDGYELVGYFEEYDTFENEVKVLKDNTYSSKTLYAKWRKI